MNTFSGEIGQKHFRVLYEAVDIWSSGHTPSLDHSGGKLPNCLARNPVSQVPVTVPMSYFQVDLTYFGDIYSLFQVTVYYPMTRPFKVHSNLILVCACLILV